MNEEICFLVSKITEKHLYNSDVSFYTNNINKDNVMVALSTHNRTGDKTPSLNCTNISTSSMSIIKTVLENDERASKDTIEVILAVCESPQKLSDLNDNASGKFADKNTLTRKEAANYLTLSVSGFDKIKKRESIPYYYYGTRALRFKKSDLDDYIRKTRIS